MKQKHTTIQTEKRRLVKYIVQEDCTLNYTNFEAGEEIEIPEEPDNHWKGTDWFDQYPQLFEPVYEPLIPFEEVTTPIEVKEGQHTPGIARIEKDLATGELYVMIGLKHILTISINAEYEANATRIVECWNGYEALKEQNRELVQCLSDIVAYRRNDSLSKQVLQNMAKHALNKHNK